MKINKVSLNDLYTYTSSYILLFFILLLTACNSSEDDNTNDDNNLNGELIQETLLNSSMLLSFQTIDCTLEDGSEGECYIIVFSSNLINNGPFCPETVNEIGGVGFYDGNTNPGFQVIDSELFNAMETDGYNITDNSGNVYIDDLSGPTNPGGFSYCLEPVSNVNLEFTYLNTQNAFFCYQ